MGRSKVLRMQCAHCHGSGEIDGEPCPYCGGKGFLVQKKDPTSPNPLKEQSPINSMGSSSSTHGTGNIDTYDPIISNKKQKLFTRLLPIVKNIKRR